MLLFEKKMRCKGIYINSKSRINVYSLLPLYLEKDVYQYLNVIENSSMRTIIMSLF